MSRKTRREVPSAALKQATEHHLKGVKDAYAAYDKVHGVLHNSGLPRPDKTALDAALFKLRVGWANEFSPEDAEVVRDLIGTLCDTAIALIDVVNNADMVVEESVAAGMAQAVQRKAAEEADNKRRAEAQEARRVEKLAKMEELRENARRQRLERSGQTQFLAR